MYYYDPHEIISSLVTPLMDVSKRAREYIVEISLDDAPAPVVRRLVFVRSGRLFCRLDRKCACSEEEVMTEEKQGKTASKLKILGVFD